MMIDKNQRIRIKRHERRISKRLAYLFAICVFALVVNKAKADVPTPPPATFQQAIQQSPNGSTIRVNVSNGNSLVADIPQSSSRTYSRTSYVGGAAGGVVHGVKNLDVLLKDTHGATARGQISTTTKMPGASTLSNLVGGLMAAQLLGQSVDGYNRHGVAHELSTGNYPAAYAKMAMANAEALARFGDGVSFGLGTATYNFLNDLLIHKNEEYVANFQSEAEARAALYDPSISAISIVFLNSDGGHQYVHGQSVILHVFPNNIPYLGIRGNSAGTHFAVFGGGQQLTQWKPNPPLPARIGMHSVANDPKYYVPPPVDFNQAIPTEAEIVQALQALLANNQQNTQLLTDIVNLLAANGKLNETNTTTTVDNGGTATTTFLTAPYTPQGSDQAQQTKFVINKDGSVSVSTIARPDLAANTSQAPTRSRVGQSSNSNANETRPVKDTATEKAPDICANNPNSLMCLAPGSTDYSDPVLPTQSRNLTFNPLNIFGSTGVCPKSKSIGLMGVNLEIKYDPMCDIAEKVRPIIIMLGIMTAMFIAYGAVSNE